MNFSRTASRSLLAVFSFVWFTGCTIQVIPPPPDNSNDNDNGNGGGSTRSARIAPGQTAGLFAVGDDEGGNEYAFRSRSGAGSAMLTEANIRTPDGKLLKASLDDQGRPVNFRSSDNTAADLVYSGNTVRVRLTDADGNVIEDVSGIDTDAAANRAVERRSAKLARNPGAAETRQFSLEATLSSGLSDYEVITLSIFDDEFNPGSPLVRSSFAGAALSIGEFVSVFEIVEVPTVEIIEVIVIDDTPDILELLAGQTFVLFDAEGFCLEQTDVASRLTFDNDGLLQSEFDRRLVFPDLSLGGSSDPGITVNYNTGTPINLTPEAAPGFELLVTPIFTGTQIDDGGGITIERRFAADAGFDSDVFGPTIGPSSGLFDAALVNGRLSPDGNVLDADLILVDLTTDAPITVGRLRYHNQNSPEPARVFDCNVITGERLSSRIVCPVSVNESELFDVVFLPGRENEGRMLAFEWFVSDGFGFVVGDPSADATEVLAVGAGFLDVSLVVSDLSANALAYQVYTCGVQVVPDIIIPPPVSELIIECPAGLNVGEPGVFSVSGSDINDLDSFDWYVLGTSSFYISEPFSPATIIEIYQPGKFDVAFQGYGIFGDELYVTCEVIVGGVVVDECALNGFYGDGICDEFCLEPDPDCDVFFDLCELNGWYGDGECDDFCPEPDPDCVGEFFDICLESGLYGDGSCDLFCPEPDPDCDTFDICLENDWYGDGVCDEVCPLPDPDCDGVDDEDFCAVLGYYDDGRCDEGCPLPDPDCDGGEIDICAENGWYGDGECDDFCPFLDPDCE